MICLLVHLPNQDLKRKFQLAKVTGKCDSGCGRDAKHWFNNTANAHCGDRKCFQIQESRYAEHCKVMEKQFQFEKEMRDIYGDPDEY